jgi:hypothetical protein
MYALSLRRADHVKKFSIRQTDSSGWEVRLEEDRTVRRLSHYWDWHRVERALAAFKLEALELTERGWQVCPSDVVSR